MKSIFAIALVIVLCTACSQAATSAATTTPVPSQPAANFPTLAPETVPLCQVADLETSTNSSGASDLVALGVTLTNISKSTCKLTNPPQAILLSDGTQTMHLDVHKIDPKQTPPAPEFVQLAPASSVIASMLWQNFCQETKTGDFVLRLDLSGEQFLNVSLKLPVIPDCLDKNQPSSMIVTPYSIPP